MGLWDLPRHELEAPTAVRARDLIVECFFQAQRETLERSASKRGKSASDEELKKTIVHSVRTAMHESGCDWDKPTPRKLRDAVERLGARAAAWGTPEDIIKHHGAQIMRLLDACESKV